MQKLKEGGEEEDSRKISLFSSKISEWLEGWVESSRPENVNVTQMIVQYKYIYHRGISTVLCAAPTYGLPHACERRRAVTAYTVVMTEYIYGCVFPILSWCLILDSLSVPKCPPAFTSAQKAPIGIHFMLKNPKKVTFVLLSMYMRSKHCPNNQ